MRASVVCFRMDCYKCITESLDFLLATNASHPQSTSVPKSPGPPPAKDESRLTTAEADHYVSISIAAFNWKFFDLVTSRAVL